MNSHDAHRMTALHYAAKYGRIEVVRLLLNNGANPLIPGDVDECLPVGESYRYPTVPVLGLTDFTLEIYPILATLRSSISSKCASCIIFELCAINSSNE